MPFSFSHMGPVAILVMIGCLAIGQLVRYLRKKPSH